MMYTYRPVKKKKKRISQLGEKRVRKKGGQSARTDGVVQVPVPQVVDGAPRPAHDQRAGSKQSNVLQRDGWGRVERE
jgi:hypothetical protein